MRGIAKKERVWNLGYIVKLKVCKKVLVMTSEISSGQAFEDSATLPKMNEWHVVDFEKDGR